MDVFQRVTICNGLDCGYVIEWIYVYSLFESAKEISFHFDDFLCCKQVKNFHYVYFWVVVVYRVIFLVDVKVRPSIVLFLFLYVMFIKIDISVCFVY